MKPYREIPNTTCFWRHPNWTRCWKKRMISPRLRMLSSFCEEHNAKWLIEVTYPWRTAV